MSHVLNNIYYHKAPPVHPFHPFLHHHLFILDTYFAHNFKFTHTHTCRLYSRPADDIPIKHHTRISMKKLNTVCT